MTNKTNELLIDILNKLNKVEERLNKLEQKNIVTNSSSKAQFFSIDELKEQEQEVKQNTIKPKLVETVDLIVKEFTIHPPKEKVIKG